MPEPGRCRLTLHKPAGCGKKSASWDLRQRLEIFEDLAGEWNEAWETSKELVTNLSRAPPASTVGLTYRDATPSVLAILAAGR